MPGPGVPRTGAMVPAARSAAGRAASIVVETWGLAARAIGVPMRAAGIGSHYATPGV